MGDTLPSLGFNLEFPFLFYDDYMHWAVGGLSCGCFAVDEGNNSASACSYMYMLWDGLLRDFAMSEACGISITINMNRIASMYHFLVE